MTAMLQSPPTQQTVALLLVARQQHAYRLSAYNMGSEIKYINFPNVLCTYCTRALADINPQMQSLFHYRNLAAES
jgi:hypothetical protein